MKGLILALLPIFVACLQKKEEPRVDISAKGSKSHSLPTLPERTQFTYEDLIVPANRPQDQLHLVGGGNRLGLAENNQNSPGNAVLVGSLATSGVATILAGVFMAKGRGGKVHEPAPNEPMFNKGSLDEITTKVDKENVAYVVTPEASLFRFKKFEFQDVLARFENGNVLVGLAKKPEHLSGMKQYKIQSLEDPLPISDIARLGLLDKDLNEFIEEVPTKGQKGKITNPLYLDALKELDKLKTKFGAKLEDNPPLLTDKRRFLGLPMDTVTSWISNAITKKWFPRAFWKKAGAFFKLPPEGESKYSFIYKYIAAVHNAKQVQVEMNRRLLESDNPTKFFQDETGLTLHTSVNSPRIQVDQLDGLIFSFEAQFERARKEGTLEEFFANAFDPSKACFEARMRKMGEYVIKHPINDSKLSKEEQATARAERLQLERLVEYGDPPHHVAGVLTHEIQKFATNGGDPYNPVAFEKYLENQGSEFFENVIVKQSNSSEIDYSSEAKAITKMDLYKWTHENFKFDTFDKDDYPDYFKKLEEMFPEQ